MIKKHIVYTDYSDWRFTLSRAQGSYLWDDKGKRYIDFTSGWNVTNLGWNHPEVNDAAIAQAKKNVYNPMWTDVDIQEKFANALVNALPQSLDTVCRATGGTEANEEAIKIARAATGRKKIIGFKDSYHGQSFGTLAIGFRPEYVKAISPLVPEFIQLDYPNIYRTEKSEKKVLREFLVSLEKILAKRDVAAFITEAGMITGWGSALVAPKGYLKTVRKLTKKYGTLLILDEVGTGFSRIGKLFGMEVEGVIPDIATFAKGISNGAAAIGVAVTPHKLVSPTIPDTTLTSTFGWTSVACAAALKTLEIHKRDRVWEQASEKGKYIKQRLKQELSDQPNVGDIRGIGMEIGIDFVKDKKSKKKDAKITEKVVARTFKEGLHIVWDHESVIQLMPPLTISKKDLKEGTDILVSIIKTS